MAFGFLAAGARTPSALFSTDDYARQRAFFDSRPLLAPTPLGRLASLAHTLGLRDLRAKDETSRFGLNAFKAVGAAFAIAELNRRGELRPGDVVACASEGNHGRAVAHAAAGVGCAARVYLSNSVTSSRIDAIQSEGATVIQIDGTYDAAVRAMVRDADAYGWRVISDTALSDNDHEVPRLIMLGYTRLMDEVVADWRPDPPFDVVFVPGGVGGLLAAVADWCRAHASWKPAVVCVEPESAACLQVSARARHPITLAGPFPTTMAGLRCGEVSRAGFETIRDHVTAYVAIEDHWSSTAMRALAAGGDGDAVIQAGASGAAALGGLLAVLTDPAVSDLKAALHFGPESRVLVVVSEGVTDPQLFASIVHNPNNGQSDLKNREP